ncbi:11166_t:CDS:1, partial [Funneliformis mosseae]
ITNIDQYPSDVTTNTNNHHNSTLPMNIDRKRTINSHSQTPACSENQNTSQSCSPLLNDQSGENLVAISIELQELYKCYNLIKEDNKNLRERLKESEETVNAYGNASIKKDEILKNKNYKLLEIQKKLFKQSFDYELKLKELNPYKSRVEEKLRIVNEL